MDKKFLKEQNLYEAHKQFLRLCEMTILPEELDEDDDTEQPQQGQEPTMDGAPMDGGEMPQGDPSMQGDPNAMADPAMQGAPMDADPNAMGGEMPQGDPSMEGGDPNDMADPMMGGDMPPMDEPQADEEVIDVEDLTNAQEDMNHKVNTVGKDLGQVEDKISALLQSIENMQSMIDKNNSEIEAFKQEFEKRNPTQTEKLNLRSLNSYPYNVNVEDFWKDKNANSNYDVYSDNSEKPDSNRSLEITNSDVDDFSEREIADSFDIDDDLQQTIEKIFA